MTDADIHAFGPALHADPGQRPDRAAPPRRRRWGWVGAIGLALLLALLLMAGLAAALVGAVFDSAGDPVHVVLNGQDLAWHEGGVAMGLGVLFAVGLALVLALVVTAVALLFVLPLVLAVALFGVVFAVGAAVLSAASAAALALSPLLLLAGLLWLAFRAGRRRSA
jgi:hypothetical protein